VMPTVFDEHDKRYRTRLRTRGAEDPRRRAATRGLEPRPHEHGSRRLAGDSPPIRARRGPEVARWSGKHPTSRAMRAESESEAVRNGGYKRRSSEASGADEGSSRAKTRSGGEPGEERWCSSRGRSAESRGSGRRVPRLDSLARCSKNRAGTRRHEAQRGALRFSREHFCDRRKPAVARHGRSPISA